MKAAEAVFRANGFQRISMDKIAEKADLSKGTLYLYFKNKEEIIVELITRNFEKLLNLTRENSQADGTFEDVLTGMIQLWFDYFSEHQKFFTFIHHGLYSRRDEILRELRIKSMSFKDDIIDIVENLMERYGKSKFRVNEEEFQILLNGVIGFYITAKFSGLYKGEISTRRIVEVILRGALK